MKAPFKKKSKTGLYIVRLYDGFDNRWIDVSPVSDWKDALTAWTEKTKNGTERTSYVDIDYYDIFPSNTKMMYS